MLDGSVALMTEQIVPVVGIVCGVGFPMALAIVWITLSYYKRRRLMELHHTERMAAIERGMDIPPLPAELTDGRGPRRRRTSLLPGLIWFFVGLALIIMMRSADDQVGALSGLIPLGVGLAYLIYYAVEGRKIEARQLDHELAVRSNEGRADKQIGGTAL